MGDASQTTTRLAALLSHDLKQPVRQVRQFAELLQATLTPSLDLLPPEVAEQTSQYLSHLVTASTSINQMIDRLMGMSKALFEATTGPPGEPETAALLAWHEVMRDGLWRAGSTFTINLPDCHVGLSQAGLVTVWSNLISNACKYTDGPAHIEISGSAQDQVCTFLIKDYGQGIKHRDRLRIFDLFQRANQVEEGDGVGLALCKMILEGVGGTLDLIKSRECMGSTFQFTIPRIIFQTFEPKKEVSP